MRREDRRGAILDHAVEVFGRLGFHNATTAELSRAAGISEALLYQHFPSKQALLIACIEALGDDIHDGLQTVLQGNEADPTRTFQALLAQLRGFMRAQPHVNRFGLVILAELEDGAVREAVRGIVTRSVELLTRALRRGQKRGVLRADLDPEAMSWLLVGVYQLFGLLKRLELLDRVDARALQTLVRPFLAAR